MAKQTVAQESFAAGEISPLTYGRYSTDGYQSGCKSLLNMIPDSRGPARARGGSRYVDMFDGNDGRLETFPISQNFFYSLIFLDEKLIIGDISGSVVPSTNYAVNSRWYDGDANWTETTVPASYVTYASGLCSLVVEQKSNRYARISQQVTVPASGQYRVILKTHGGEYYNLMAGTAEADGTYLDILSDATEQSQLITVPGTTFWITVEGHSDFTLDRVEMSFFGVSDAVVTNPEFVTPWKENELRDIHIIPSPGGNAGYLVHPKYAPRKLEYDSSTDAFTFSTVSFTNPPAVWTGTNWPSTGAYFEGRLWLAGSPDEPQTIWASKSGLPEDFTVGTGLDDESITITMSRFGRIEWVEGTKNLLAGTENGEHIITSEGGVITPSDHQVTQQSAYGAANTQAEIVGDQVFYVSPDRRKVRAMQYEWSADNWLSTDLTYFSEHITNARIRELSWQQNPDNILWCLLEDGTLAALSYDRSNNIYGWSRHDIGGTVVSISAGAIQGTHLIGCLVKRMDGKVHLESQWIDKVHYMDSWIDIDDGSIQPTGTKITGLDHLEGETVQVLVDEAVHPDRVVSGGEIELAFAGTRITVGLPYTKGLGLLPMEKGARNGPSMPYWKNFHSIHAHLLDSAHPLVNGDRAPERNPSTPMGTVEPNTTGKSYINLTQWKNETDITISQDLPKPLNVLAVSGEINQEDL